MGFRKLAKVVIATDASTTQRQAGVYPVEVYGEARIREFEKADRLTAAERARLRRKLKRPYS